MPSRCPQASRIQGTGCESPSFAVPVTRKSQSVGQDKQKRAESLAGELQGRGPYPKAAGQGQRQRPEDQVTIPQLGRMRTSRAARSTDRALSLRPDPRRQCPRHVCGGAGHPSQPPVQVRRVLPRTPKKALPRPKCHVWAGEGREQRGEQLTGGGEERLAYSPRL